MIKVFPTLWTNLEEKSYDKWLWTCYFQRESINQNELPRNWPDHKQFYSPVKKSARNSLFKLFSMGLGLHRGQRKNVCDKKGGLLEKRWLEWLEQNNLRDAWLKYNSKRYFGFFQQILAKLKLQCMKFLQQLRNVRNYSVLTIKNVHMEREG